MPVHGRPLPDHRVDGRAGARIAEVRVAARAGASRGGRGGQSGDGGDAGAELGGRGPTPRRACHREAAAPEDRRHGDRRQPAVFLDRDGTLIEDVPYLSDPAGIRFLPGAVEALVRLRQAGFARVLVTNQSGIGRGLFTEDRLREIHAELEGRLAAIGASLDGIYYCPSAPDEGEGRDCPDRKPAPGMLLRGADELGIDLGASWMVGDKMSDVLAGLNAGCRSILLRADASDEPGAADPAAAGGFLVAPDLSAAVDLILDGEDRGR